MAVAAERYKAVLLAPLLPLAACTPTVSGNPPRMDDDADDADVPCGRAKVLAWGHRSPGADAGDEETESGPLVGVLPSHAAVVAPWWQDQSPEEKERPRRRPREWTGPAASSSRGEEEDSAGAAAGGGGEGVGEDPSDQDDAAAPAAVEVRRVRVHVQVALAVQKQRYLKAQGCLEGHLGQAVVLVVLVQVLMAEVVLQECCRLSVLDCADMHH